MKIEIAEAGLKISEVIRELGLPAEYAMCLHIYDIKTGKLVTTANVNTEKEIVICKLALEMLENRIPSAQYILNDEKKRD